MLQLTYRMSLLSHLLLYAIIILKKLQHFFPPHHSNVCNVAAAWSSSESLFRFAGLSQPLIVESISVYVCVCVYEYFLT